MATKPTIRIGTRASKLAVWQATQVQQLLLQHGYAAILVPVTSEGDIDLHTPLYEMGVQGIFTRSLDIALLQNKIDIAVHSLKDMPVTLAAGLVQAAVLPRGNAADVLVLNPTVSQLADNLKLALQEPKTPLVCSIASSSLRRRAQWLHRFTHHTIENLRGNVNSRLQKLAGSQWHGAIFASAGLERIGLLPSNAIPLPWMLPAPAQGAIAVVARAEDNFCLDACRYFNDATTELCTTVERKFLKALMGGCSAPIGALATLQNGQLHLEGNLLSLDGRQCLQVSLQKQSSQAEELVQQAAASILAAGGDVLLQQLRQ
jgi:hydroxymethylbilane synthase